MNGTSFRHLGDRPTGPRCAAMHIWPFWDAFDSRCSAPRGSSYFFCFNHGQVFAARIEIRRVHFVFVDMAKVTEQNYCLATLVLGS